MKYAEDNPYARDFALFDRCRHQPTHYVKMVFFSSLPLEGTVLFRIPDYIGIIIKKLLLFNTDLLTWFTPS